MAIILNQTLNNRYHVQEYIGRGGMAEVYKVWDSQRMVHLAIKVLHEDMALDRVFVRRFVREAEYLARLQHPNIVRFYSFEKEGRLAYLVLDYIEGETLRHLIHDTAGPLPTKEILRIIRSVCGALQFAHQGGLVHCDLKPANIMFDLNNSALLSDFGIARVTDAATATMVGAGTPAYMAPEQIRGENPIPQTDIYALGIVLYEMMTGGERPFTGETAQKTGSTGEKIRWEQQNLQPPSPQKWNPEVTPQLEAVVMKCLEKNPDSRFQNALELLNALEMAVGTPVDSLPVEPEAELAFPEPIEPKKESVSAVKALKGKPRRKLLGWSWMVIGAIVMGGVIGVLTLGNVGSQPQPVALEDTASLTTDGDIIVVEATNTPALISTITFTVEPIFTPTWAEPFTYSMKQGDSLFSIADQFGVDYINIMLLNGLTNETVLYIGDTLIIPNSDMDRPTPTPLPPNLPRGAIIQYFVLPGDSVQLIAEKFQSTAEKILEENELETSSAIYPGQILSVPNQIIPPDNNQTLTQTPGIDNRKINPVDGATMVKIPVGEFLMGAEEEQGFDACMIDLSNPEICRDVYPEELPEHVVYLDEYYIYQTEVTNEQFAEFLSEFGNQVEGGAYWYKKTDPFARIMDMDGPWSVIQGYADHEVNAVTWFGANSYCEWAGGRLPTEAEWEKAARGTDGRVFPWGLEKDCIYAPFRGCKYDTQSVGSYSSGSSPFGVLGMVGYYFEWVNDWYDAHYYKISPYENPMGPSTGQWKVLKGAGPYRAARPARRFSELPNYPKASFRCVIEP